MSADRERSLHRLEREHGNLRAALDHLLSADETTAEACRMAVALTPFWHDHGHLVEGRRWLAAARQRAGNADRDLEASVMLAAARLAYEDDDVDEAVALAESALCSLDQTGD